MAYFPSNKVTTNLYTNGGEFFIQGTNIPYIGYYHKFSTGEIFTGQNPNVSNTRPLIKTPTTIPTQITNIPYTVVIVNSNENQEYIKTKKVDVNSLQTLPTPHYPQPTSNDYQIGEFQRYFVKKGNESKFLEISLEDYRKYVNRDRDVMFELYTPIQINWILTGEKEQVYRVNQSIVARAEREQNLPGFTQYFRNRFTQFYKYIEASNLYTAGNEFKTEKGVNYIGFYHIHDSKGPMVGKTHIEDPHEYLFPINETIISRTQNQTPNFIPQNNVATTQSIYTPSNISMGGGGGGGGGGGY